MSQIFDALQRSEAERKGSATNSDSRATELLQRAESQVAAGRPAGPSPDSWKSAAIPEADFAIEEQMQPPSVITGLLTERGFQAAEERVEGPMQCEILKVSATPDRGLVSLPEHSCPATEAFHLLGVRLRHMRRQRPLKKILITSTIPQEGKSMVAANLACTLALRTQQRVILVEGDIRRPTQSRIFGIEEKAGICACLKGDQSLLKSMYRLDGAGIWILPAGDASGISLELLQSGRVIPLMEQLTSWFDWIVIDSPPILPLADTSVWSNITDGILLVTRQGKSQKRQLQRGLEALGTQKLVGAILNSAASVAHTDYYYRPSNRLPTDDAEA